MQCVVLAGGRGTRLGDHSGDRPKYLTDIAGRPFADLQLEVLRNAGVTNVVYCIGFRGDQIRNYIGNGEAFGMSATYVDEGDQLLGTGGAVRLAYDYGQLDTRFVTIYGDTLPTLDIRAAYEFASTANAVALMTVMRNQGQFDVSNADFDGRLVTYNKRNPTDEMEWIDYGVSILTTAFASAIPDGVVDLATIFEQLSDRGELVGYPVDERFHEIGTPESRDELVRRLSELKDH